MALTFSCTALFITSYCWNTRAKVSLTRRMTSVSTTASMTAAMIKIRLICPLMTKHMTMLDSIEKGARMLVRSSIWKAFCRFDTSVVMRVTRPEVEYLSMSLNAKRWMLRYMARRRLAAKPVEA